MATRFYLPLVAGTSPLPSLAVGGWTVSGANFFRGHAAREKFYNTALTTYTHAVVSGTTRSSCAGQWVSDPLTQDFLFTTSHTVSLVVKTQEAATTYNGHIALLVRVVQSDGSTIRGTLFTRLATTATEFPTTAATRIISAAALSELQCYAGDRIVIEIGSYQSSPTGSGNITMTFGDSSSTADYALTSALTTTLDPWVEISADIPTTTGVRQEGSTGNRTGDYKYASRFKCFFTSYAKKLQMKIGDPLNYTPSVKAVIYSDSAGAPATLLATSEAVNIATGAAIAWYEFTFSTPIALSAGTYYWMGLITSKGMQSAGLGSTTNMQAYNSDTYSDGATSTFGTATYSTTYQIVYVSEWQPLSATITAGAAAASCAVAAEYTGTDRTATVGVTAAAAGCAVAASNYKADIGVTAAKACGAGQVIAAAETFASTVGVTGAAAGCAVAATEWFAINMVEPQSGNTYHKDDALDVHFSVPCRTSLGRFNVYVVNASENAPWNVRGYVTADGRAGDYELTVSIADLAPDTDWQVYIFWFSADGAVNWSIYNDSDIHTFTIVEPPRTLSIGVTAAKASTAIDAVWFDDSRTLNVGVTGAAASVSVAADTIHVTLVSPTTLVVGSTPDIQLELSDTHLYGKPYSLWWVELDVNGALTDHWYNAGSGIISNSTTQVLPTLPVQPVNHVANSTIFLHIWDGADWNKPYYTGPVLFADLHYAIPMVPLEGQVGVTAAKAGTQIAMNTYKITWTSVGSPLWEYGADPTLALTISPALQSGRFAVWPIRVESPYDWHIGHIVQIVPGQTNYSFVLPITGSSTPRGFNYYLFTAVDPSSTGAWEWDGAGNSGYNGASGYANYIDVAAQVGVTGAKAGVSVPTTQTNITQQSPVTTQIIEYGGQYPLEITVVPPFVGNVYAWWVDKDGNWIDAGGNFGHIFDIVLGQTSYSYSLIPSTLVDGQGYFVAAFRAAGAPWGEWAHLNTWIGIDYIHVQAQAAVSAAAANSSIAARETFASAMGVTGAAAGMNIQSYVYWAQIAVTAMAAGMSSQATLTYLMSLGCAAGKAGVAVNAAETFVMTVGVTAAAAGTAITVFQGLFLDIVMMAAKASVAIEMGVHRYQHPHQRASRRGVIAADLAPHRARQTSGIIVDSIAHRATQKKGAVDGFDN